MQRELAGIGQTVAEAVSHSTLDAIQSELRSLAERIDQRPRAPDPALSGIERGLNEVRDALHALAPAEGLAGSGDEIKTLSHEVDSIGASGPAPETLDHLETAISERAQARDTLEARIDAIHKLHTRISERLAPIVDDSYFDLVTTAEDVGKGADKIVKSLVNDGLQLMQTIVQIGAETNLITGLLTASSLTASPSIMSMLEDRFAASVGRLKKQVLKLPDDAKYAGLRQQLAALSAAADFQVHVAAPGSEGDLHRLARVFEIHEALTGVLLTLVDDLNFDLVAQSDDAVKRTSKLVDSLVANQISQLRQALEIDPDNAPIWNNLGLTLADQGQSAEALDAWQRAIEVDPDYAEAIFNLADAHEDAGRTADSRPLWKAYLRLDDDSEWERYARRCLDSKR